MFAVLKYFDKNKSNNQYKNNILQNNLKKIILSRPTFRNFNVDFIKSKFFTRRLGKQIHV